MLPLKENRNGKLQPLKIDSLPYRGRKQTGEQAATEACL